MVKIKSLLEEVRAPRAMIYTVNAGAVPTSHWTLDGAIGGGRIIGEACHFIDLLRFLAGAPITSARADYLGGADGRLGDVASLHLQFGDGSVGTVHYLANGHANWPKERLEIFTGGRVLQLDNFRKLTGWGWSASSKTSSPEKGHQAAVAAFLARHLRTGGRSPIRPREGNSEVSEPGGRSSWPRAADQPVLSNLFYLLLRKKIALVAGTRPEVIKLAPVYFALRESSSLEPVLLSSGQHRQMIDQAFAVFGLKPEIDLNLMQPGQTLPDLTARVVTNVAAVLRELQPAAILAQGDTTTVLGAALAAFYERVPLGHVEAGLRTYNFDAPWPEEMNRRLADPLARWCFAPTAWSAANLRAERIPEERIHVTGNTVVDALLWVREKLRRSPQSPAETAARCGIPGEFAGRYLEESQSRFVLITGHRRESFGRGFRKHLPGDCRTGAASS